MRCSRSRAGTPTPSPSARPASSACASPPWPTSGRTARACRGAVGSARCSAARTSRRWSCGARARPTIADPAALKALIEETREPLTTGHEGAVHLRHAVPRRPDQRARRARQLQPPAARSSPRPSDRRRVDEGALPRPGHDVPEVPGGVRQAVRDPRRRVRGHPGQDAGVRDRSSRSAPMLGIANSGSADPAPTTSATCSGWTRSRWASRWRSSARRSSAAGSSPAEVGVPFGWGDWRGMLKLVEMTARARGVRRPPGRGRVAARRVRASRGDAPGVRGQAPGAARALGARAQGPVDRLRDGHARRQPPRHAADAAVRARASTGAARTSKPAFAVRSQHFTAVGDSLVAVSLHLRARLRPVRRASPTRGWCAPITGWDMSVDELERVGRADHQPRAALQRARGRAPRATTCCRGR